MKRTFYLTTIGFAFVSNEKQITNLVHDCSIVTQKRLFAQFEFPLAAAYKLD